MFEIVQLDRQIKCQVEPWPKSIKLPFIHIYNASHLYTVTHTIFNYQPTCPNAEPLIIPKGNHLVKIPKCGTFKGLEVVQPEEKVGNSSTLAMPKMVRYRLHKEAVIFSGQSRPTHKLVYGARKHMVLAQREKDNQNKAAQDGMYG